MVVRVTVDCKQWWFQTWRFLGHILGWVKHFGSVPKFHVPPHPIQSFPYSMSPPYPVRSFTLVLAGVLFPRALNFALKPKGSWKQSLYHSRQLICLDFDRVVSCGPTCIGTHYVELEQTSSWLSPTPLSLFPEYWGCRCVPTGSSWALKWRRSLEGSPGLTPVGLSISPELLNWAF